MAFPEAFEHIRNGVQKWYFYELVGRQNERFLFGASFTDFVQHLRLARNKGKEQQEKDSNMSYIFHFT